MKVRTNLRAGSGGASGVGGNSTATDTSVVSGGVNSPKAVALAAATAYYASPEYQAYLATLPARCVGA
jgi:hypothetical protein